MKLIPAFILSIIAASVIGSVSAAPMGTPTFSADPVNVNDTYIVFADDLRPGEVIQIAALYADVTYSCEGNATAGGTFSCEFTAVDLGRDTDGGKFRHGDGPSMIAEPGEVIHIVWQLKANGCGHNGCYDMVAHGTLTVLP